MRERGLVDSRRQLLELSLRCASHRLSIFLNWNGMQSRIVTSSSSCWNCAEVEYAIFHPSPPSALSKATLKPYETAEGTLTSLLASLKALCFSAKTGY